MKKLMAILAVLLVAGVSSAANIGRQLPDTGEPGRSADFTDIDATGTYWFGYSLTSITFNFSHGTTFVGALWDCDTRTQSAGTCDKITDLTSAEETGTFTTKRRNLLVVISTAEGAGTVSTLVVKGGWTLGGGGGGLDDLIVTANCSGNAVAIGNRSGVYYIPSTASCVAGDVITLSNLSSFDPAGSIIQSIVNDSGASLTVDGTANTTVTTESGSSFVPDGSTFSVVQVASSSVHIVGTGGGSPAQPVLFCGELGANADTFFGGPNVEFLAGAVDHTFASAACNTLGNTTVATADNDIDQFSGYTVTGMFCQVSAAPGSAATTMTFVDDTAATAVTCDIASAETSCVSALGVTVVVAANSQVAVSSLNGTDDENAQDMHCIVYVVWSP